MIAALLLGRKGSVGFPGKNTYPVLGRPLMAYPLLAALHAKQVDKVFISTDDEDIMEIGRAHGANIIVRPPELCTKEALGEDAFVHGYKYIKEQSKDPVEMIVLLFCNAPCLLPRQIDDGINVLRANRLYDSAVTVSKYNMYSPVRARKIGANGLLHPFVPFEAYAQSFTVNCDRDSQGDVYFADVCLSIVRPRCLEDIDKGMLPQKWMGQNIYPIKQWGGLDVDFEWQVPQIEYWLKEHGFVDERSLPYEVKK